MGRGRRRLDHRQPQLFFDALSSVSVSSSTTRCGCWACTGAADSAICAIAYWLHRNWIWWRHVAGLLLILNLGFWDEMTETWSRPLCDPVSLLIGIPSHLAARRPWFYRGLQPVLDMMQTLRRSLSIPTLILFGSAPCPA